MDSELDEVLFTTSFQKSVIARMKQANLGAAALEMARLSNPLGGSVPPIENELRSEVEGDR